MCLTLREQEKLLVSVAADLARRRRQRGVKLNYPEAVALIAGRANGAARVRGNVPCAGVAVPAAQSECAASLVVLLAGGLLDGDDVAMDVAVESGAHLALRTQAATLCMLVARDRRCTRP